MAWLERLETKGVSVLTDDNFTPADAALRPSFVPRSRYPFGRDVGIGLDSNVVMAPINWILRNFTEADLMIQQKRGRIWEENESHPLLERLLRPNPYHTGGLLWKATVTSFALDGNAYWQKVRNRFGEVLGFWYLPHFLMEPRWPRDGTVHISHYDYTPEWGGPKIPLPVRDVVHYRWGLDPRNTRKGMSPIKPLLREVFTDEEASNFSAAILRNMGVPGGVIAPKDKDALPGPEDVKQMKAYMKEAFTGDRRGEWLVLGTPTETSQFGFDPQSLMLGNLRDIAEERVCATLGIPAAVVGFGAGLNQTKVGATMRELREEAWDSCITPMQHDLAEQGTGQLVPDFNANARRYRIRFDTSSYAAAQESEGAKAERVAMLVEKSVLRVDRGQAMLGLEVDETQQVYLRPANTVAVDPAATAGGDEQDEDAALARAVEARLGNGSAP
jgi:HK97 family phage portal protein